MLKPLGERVVVKPIAQDDKTQGGIIVPQRSKEAPQEGVVVAVGAGLIKEGNERTPLDVKPGDRILFGKYAGSEIKIDGEMFLVMNQEDILGTL